MAVTQVVEKDGAQVYRKLKLGPSTTRQPSYRVAF